MLEITIIRNEGWFGKLRAAKILADDVEIGKVKSGETISVQVPDNSTSLTAKIDMSRSNSYPVSNVANGQTIYLNSWFTLHPLKNLGILPLPFALEDEPR